MSISKEYCLKDVDIPLLRLDRPLLIDDPPGAPITVRCRILFCIQIRWRSKYQEEIIESVANCTYIFGSSQQKRHLSQTLNVQQTLIVALNRFQPGYI